MTNYPAIAQRALPMITPLIEEQTAEHKCLYPPLDPETEWWCKCMVRRENVVSDFIKLPACGPTPWMMTVATVVYFTAALALGIFLWKKRGKMFYLVSVLLVAAVVATLTFLVERWNSLGIL